MRRNWAICWMPQVIRRCSEPDLTKGNFPEKNPGPLDAARDFFALLGAGFPRDLHLLETGLAGQIGEAEQCLQAQGAVGFE